MRFTWFGSIAAGLAALGMSTSGCSGEAPSGTRAPACADNDTRPCVCAGGVPGAQTCDSGSWSACDCNGTGQGGSGGSGATATTGGTTTSATTTTTTGSSSASTSSGVSAPTIGDTCSGDIDCLGGSAELACAYADLPPGVCTIACGSFADCTEIVVGKPFWDCCAIQGSSVCVPQEWCTP